MSDLFKCLDSINQKTPYTYNKKDCNGYMLAMWLSHDPSLIGLCNDINPHIFELPDELIFKYFFKKVPQKKRFIKWTKKTKGSEKREVAIRKLMEEQDISHREASLSIR